MYLVRFLLPFLVVAVLQQRTPAWSQPRVAPADCSVVVSINSVSGVLYKPTNPHGARGPTFLVQNPRERTNKRSIQVRDVSCKIIARFGLYRTDWPYGSRYYQRVSGGSYLDARSLLRLARKAGSSAILVESRAKWLKINNPLLRQGSVNSP